MARNSKPKILRLARRQDGRQEHPATPSPGRPDSGEAQETRPMQAVAPVPLEPATRHGRTVEELFAEGNRLFHQGDFAAAAQRYRRALVLGGDMAVAFNNLAVACQRQGFFHEARRCVERALELEPASALYYQTAAMLSRDSGEPGRGIEYLHQALRLRGETAELLAARGHLYHLVGNHAAAHADYTRALELGPDLPGLRLSAGVAALAAGKPEIARELFDQVVASAPRSAEPHYHLGVIHVTLEDDAGAEPHLAKAHELSSTDVRVCYEYAALLARHRDERDNRGRAMEVLEACLAAHAPRISEMGRELARLQFLLASLYDDSQTGYEAAVRAYRAGLEWDPDFEMGHNNLGALYLESGEVEQALRHFERALAIRPTYRKACLNYAKALYLHVSPDELETHLERLLGLTGGRAAAALAVIAHCLVDLAEHETYSEIHERNHKVKNVLALAGNKLKRTRTKLAGSPEAASLDEVLEVLQETYSQMSAYLKAIRPQQERTERVDINRLASRVAGKLRRGRPEGCRIDLKPGAGIPPVQAEPSRLEEAILNLVKNSLEAVDGPGRVLVETDWDSEAGLVRIRVSDTGPGIPDEMRERIFRSGFTTKASGNGLGLSIVRRTVADCHGTVEAGTLPGGGACFTVRLPIDQDASRKGGGLALDGPFREDPGSLIVEELA